MSAAAKSAKSDDGDDDDGDDIEKAPAKTQKSFSQELPEEIQTKIDVSEFLKSLVDHTAERIDAQSEYIAKSDLAHEQRYNELTQICEDLQKSQAKIAIVLKAMCQQMGVIGVAPAREAKADTVAKSGAAPERQFSSGLEAEGEKKVFKSLSENAQIAKSQISGALCDLVKKGEAQDLDVIGFESGGYIRPELVSKLQTVLN